MPIKRYVIQEGNAVDEHQNIIARCIAGDESAYKLLYDLYPDAMYNTG